MVGQFLEQFAERGARLHVSDQTLFPKFRAFWVRTTKGTMHPALLGQFRVELTERGFRSRGVKRPRWYGLTLHRGSQETQGGRV
jgi:hypothetical protein